MNSSNAIVADDRSMPHKRQRLPAPARIAQILDAAHIEFSERGFAAARIDDIALRCGLSKGGIYCHFKSKDDIFEMLLSRRLSLPDLHDMPAAPGVTVRQLAEWLLQRLYAVLEDPAAVSMLRLLIAESGRVPALIEAWRKNVVEPHLEMLGTMLKRLLQERPQSSASVLIREPWLLVAPLIYAMVAQSIFGDHAPHDIEQRRRAHLALLLELWEGPGSAVEAASVPALIETETDLPHL